MQMNQQYGQQGQWGAPAGGPISAAQASVDDRGAFIMKTYLHLIGAVFAFVFLEVAFFAVGLPQLLAPYMLGNRFGWLLILGGFIGVSWLARKWASGLSLIHI